MRKIKKAKIKAISLVPKGANKMKTLYKSEDGSFDFSLLTKAAETFSDKGELYAAVYVPNLVDVQGDFAEADVIKEMMYAASRDGVMIDLRHDNVALKKEQAYIAESFLIQKGDPRFAGMTQYDGTAADVTGGWGVVIQIDDPALRTLYKEGKWGGVSMFGSAEVEQVKQDAGVEAIIAAFLKKLDPQTGDTDMTPQEITALVQKSVTDALIANAAAAAAALKKTAEGVPVFKGDPMKLADVTAHQAALKKYSLTKEVDWSNPDSVAEYQTKLVELQADLNKSTAEEDAAAGIAKEDTDEVKLLKRKLAKAQKVSGQTPGKDVRKEAEDTNTFNAPAGILKKEDQDAAELGRKMALAMNIQRGYAKASA